MSIAGELIRVNRVHHPVTALGPGRRLGIWLQGCSLHCHGCISRDTWDPSAGTAMSVAKLVVECASILREDPALTGMTISGGEPFEQAQALTELLIGLKSAAASEGRVFDTLVYSGLSWAKLRRRHATVLALLDAVIPEPFLAARAPGGRWRGSANQPLRLLTTLGRERFASGPVSDERGGGPLPFQVVVEDGRMWTIGVPKPGDMDRLVELARRRGVTVGELSWRS